MDATAAANSWLELGRTLVPLVGVALGVALTLGKDVIFHRRQRAMDSGYISILLTDRLFDFAEACTSVAFDDGTVEGRPAGELKSGERYYKPQTSLPELSLDINSADWKALDRGLMYTVYELARDVRSAKRHVQEEQFEDSPPYDLAMRYRRYTYAAVGNRAFELGDEILKKAGLNSRTRGEFDSQKSLREIIKELKFDSMQPSI
ncbi:hypothetical protein VDF70_11960 [Xanthomonas campestris pv. raphani]|uniref:hypothetical protein n=1 Tax=Xanthomonas campestris TaxID=339 RepID=UPI002B227CA7|nr:hypothetical protein [Xanthomonas campestris]MEA9759767.1 hypothetical protein [Xanthomonas campestris pv. raphani]